MFYVFLTIICQFQFLKYTYFTSFCSLSLRSLPLLFYETWNTMDYLRHVTLITCNRCIGLSASPLFVSPYKILVHSEKMFENVDGLPRETDNGVIGIHEPDEP